MIINLNQYKQISIQPDFIFKRYTVEKNNTNQIMKQLWDGFWKKNGWSFFRRKVYRSEIIYAKYKFTIPAHSANVKRTFFLMSTQWSDKRNRLAVEAVEVIKWRAQFHSLVARWAYAKVLVSLCYGYTLLAVLFALRSLIAHLKSTKNVKKINKWAYHRKHSLAAEYTNDFTTIIKQT